MALDLPAISVVVIGRNEGERLALCLESVRAADYPGDKIELIYVDTDSTDDSCAAAEKLGAKVIRIQPERPTAAAARNAGLRVATHDLVHFLDGDTILDRTWLRKAVRALDDPAVACVFGRVAEIAPHATIYNFWAHHDWYVPPGAAESSGGIVLFRRHILLHVSGFDDSLIAGEEADMCCRIRDSEDATILSLDEPMALHDINMTSFLQYWRRCTRTGHAYAEVGHRHPALRSCCEAQMLSVRHCLAVGTALGVAVAIRSYWPLVIWVAMMAAAILRNAWRLRSRIGSIRAAILYSCHHYLAKIPILAGQCNFWLRRLGGRTPRALIEYRSK